MPIQAWLGIISLLAPGPAGAAEWGQLTCGGTSACDNVADQLTKQWAEEQAFAAVMAAKNEQAGSKTSTDPDKPGDAKNVANAPAPSAAPGSTTFAPASGVDSTGQANATAAATDASKKSGQYNYASHYESSLADSLAGQYDQLRSFVTARQASNNEAQKSEADSRLAQRVVPPQNFEAIYQRLGITTNQDLLDKAPGYATSLQDNSQTLAATSANWKTDAENGTRAADTMAEFHAVVVQRSADMGTLDSSVRSVAAGGSGARAPASNSAGSGSGTGSASDSNISGGAASALGGSASQLLAKKTGGAALAGDSAGGDSAGGALGGKASSSLRDELRRRLAENAAAASSTGGKKSEPGEVSFAAKVGALDADAPLASESAGAASRTFHFYGSDNDAAIAKLVGGFGAAPPSAGEIGGSDAAFGSSEVSLFQLMRHFLTRAQADKKVR